MSAAPRLGEVVAELRGGLGVAEALGADVGDAVALGVGAAGARRPGDVGAERVGRAEAGAFADEDDGERRRGGLRRSRRRWRRGPARRPRWERAPSRVEKGQERVEDAERRGVRRRERRDRRRERSRARLFAVALSVVALRGARLRLRRECGRGRGGGGSSVRLAAARVQAAMDLRDCVIAQGSEERGHGKSGVDGVAGLRVGDAENSSSVAGGDG